GYPEDMLELDLDLEADLGIDTVKQVELFAMAREDFNLPRDDTINLQDLNTLRRIIDYVVEMTGGEVSAEAPAQEKAEVKEEAHVIEEKAVDEPVSATGGMWEMVRDKVVEIVAEKTGYPEDMLELDLDLEADLGIDTVKQVELFAMAREDFDLPRDDTINLQDLNTLRRIIDYVMEKTGGEPPAAAPAGEEMKEAPAEQKAEEPAKVEKDDATAVMEKAEAGDWDMLKDRIISIVADKTGYPEDMLELDLDLEADLGIDTVKQVELFAMAREEFKLPKDDTVNLSDLPTLRHIIDYVAKLISGSTPEAAPVEKKEEPKVEEEAEEPTGETKDEEPALEKLEEAPIEEPEKADEKPAPQADKGTAGRWEMVRDSVVSIVADKTGYPEDMLELDLDLEADLGIDTVKQVELFAMAREQFNIPRDDTVNLQDLNTLRKIIDYVESTGVTGEPEPPAEEEQTGIEQLSVEELKERVNRWVFQVDEAPMVKAGQSPIKGRKALVLGGDPAAADLVGNKFGVKIIHLPQGTHEYQEDDIQDVEGIICISPLFFGDDPDPDDWMELSKSTSKLLFRTCFSLGKRLKDGGFLYSLTAMGGRFALDRSVNPFNGGISGFTKAVGREYPKADVISLDVDCSVGIDRALDLLLAEVSNEAHPLEVGCDGEKRYLPSMRIYMPPKEFNIDLSDGMSILVSGGGGGITAEIIKGLARKANLEFHIIDIAEILPDTDKLAQLDEEGLARKKEEIKEKLASENEKVTPIMVDREFSRITRSIGVFKLLKELESMGSKPHYHRSDIMDGDAIAKIAEESGPFHGIIHAAGIDLSKSLLSKKKEEFDRVYDIKVQGAKALISATTEHPLKFFLTFTSVAGRFGNTGQVDYSSANDTLAKMRGALTKYHPDLIFKAVGWSAWANVGMASRGAVKTVLEMGGITFIPVDDGVEYAISEILHGTEREVYYSGSLGPMDKGEVLKWSEGIHPPIPPEVPMKEATPKAEKAEKVEPEGLAPLLDEIIERTDSGILVKRSLDGKRERFLPDHSIMGKMVLPGVMGLEIFAETAQIMFPDLDVVSLENVIFNKAVSVDDKAPKEIFVQGELVSDEEDVKRVDLKLYSILKPKKAKKEIESVHYTGTVIMGSYDPDCQKVMDHPVKPRNVIAQVVRSEIYNHLFHDNRFRVLQGIEVLKDGELMGVFHAPPEDLFDPSTGWENGHLVTVPMQTECGFQVAGAYVLDRFKMMALPVKVGTIEYHNEMTPAEGGMAWVRFEGREENVFRFDVDFIDLDGNVRFSYRDYQLKSMMTYDGELKGDHSVHFEEFQSPVDDIRVFRIDLDSVPADLEEYVRYFGEEEWNRLITEKMTQKRRKEHAMGRVIAKLAVSWYLATRRSRVVPIGSVRILTEEGGKPYAEVDGERIEISISHSHRWAVCSVGARVHGMDIELAEHRDISFVDEAFTEEEASLISRKQKEYDLGENMVQTLFFSAKEAYLKKTGIGMGVSLKSVRCSEALQLPNKGGISFEVLVEHQGKEERVLAHIPSAYVLTICA
ncbi:MAG: phosphopantetheine-binding protein, partial [Thermoplasmatota archaeon]